MEPTFTDFLCKIHPFGRHIPMHLTYVKFLPGPGGTQLFSGRGVRPGFPKCGACEPILGSERGGL